MNFSSDNASGACDAVMDAVIAANAGSANAYGADAWTAGLKDRLQEVFEKQDIEIFPVATGTAANALALASVVPPFGSIFCHRDSHIQNDECGAPEMFTGGAKLHLVNGPNGKFTADDLGRVINASTKRGVHQTRPAAVSMTQATESGTLYQLDEIAAIAAVAREAGLPVHMDGARFANALVRLDVSVADMTWRQGVDILSFGATKNGAMGAEVVVFLTPELAIDFPWRRKRAGHLFSKMRFLSAQLCGYLDNQVWLDNARHANAMADRLSAGLLGIDGVTLLAPVEANEVFPVLPAAVNQRLRDAGAVFHDWIEGGPGCARFVMSWNTAVEDVDRLLAVAGGQP